MSTLQSVLAVSVCVVIVCGVDAYGNRLDNLLGKYLREVESAEYDDLYTNPYSDFTGKNTTATILLCFWVFLKFNTLRNLPSNISILEGFEYS